MDKREVRNPLAGQALREVSGEWISLLSSFPRRSRLSARGLSLIPFQHFPPDLLVRDQRLQAGAHTHCRKQPSIALDFLQRPVAPPDILLHPVDSALEREPCEHGIHVAVSSSAGKILLLDFPIPLKIKDPREPFFFKHRARTVGAKMAQEAAAQQRRMLQPQSLERSLEPFDQHPFAGWRNRVQTFVRMLTLDYLAPLDQAELLHLLQGPINLRRMA